MVTIKEMAQELGISPTTISNVLHGRTGRVSQETRIKIEEILKKYQYMGSTSFKEDLREQKKIVVAYYLSYHENLMTDPFCGELLGAIEKELRPLGMGVIYTVLEKEEELAQLIDASCVEGAIVVAYPTDKCEVMAKNMAKPVVFIDSGDGLYDNIGLQDYEGAHEITTYLLKQGHKRIAFFCQLKYPPVASSGERLRGFQDALQQYGVSYREEDYYFVPTDKNIYKEMFRQFARTKAGTEYTAAFIDGDLLANECINVLYSQGLSVPDNISITGFDDNIYARLSRPALTTVRQFPGIKGKEAVRLLLKRIQGQEVFVHNMQLPTELIVRESVKNIGK